MRASEMDDVIFSGNTGRPARNHAEVARHDRQQRPQGAGGLQRYRHARSLAPHHARAGLGLPRQRPRGARPRRHRAVRRRLDRLALAGAGASGPHRRDHPGAARPAPPRARRGRRHFRPACAPPRGRAAAQGRRAQSGARRGRHRPARRADRFAQDPGAAGGALPQYFRHRCAGPKRCCSTCAGSAAQAEVGDAERTKDEAVRVVAARTGEQAQASTRQADVAAGLPALREAEASAAAGLQRLLIARDDARARGGARQGADRRARPPARAIRGRPGARADAGGRRRRPRSTGSPPRRRSLGPKRRQRRAA